ncbi:DUF4402 domain-containing protein [Aliifodinibius salicampi]|uniref:DUF4402 domain-containing protein n=1 Tax=Fodinibius salicampi TaxID=1920655 RepID=A0ABT3PXQ0_9BACT|nr:DUF4402 domain-containing protein [Fodinibius salicampi]MCW9712643.1 DUF4402 domain-containing protein [Fodinibius salicampi]
MKSIIKYIFVLLLVTGITTTVSAQQADIAANATVDANVDLSSGDDLNFGNIAAGSPSTVNPGDGTAGTFSVSGNVGNVDLSFSLPSELTGSEDNLPISFGGTSASWGDNAYDSNNDFDPNDGASVNLLEQTDRDITVFIGGTVDPATNQAAGSYNGTITLTATYN